MLNSERFAIRTVVSLFRDQPSFASIKRRPLLNELASTPRAEPLNRVEGLLDKFLSIMETRNITFTPKE